MKQPQLEMREELPPFGELVTKLEDHYGRSLPPKTSDPLGLIIYENIAYLVTDDKREAAFAALRSDVGLKPTDIFGQELLTVQVS